MADIERLLAIEEIKQLKARYFRCVDAKDWEGLAAVFTDDALMDMSEGIYIRDLADGRLVPPPGAAIPPFEEADHEAARMRGIDQIIPYVRSQLDGARTVHHGHTPEIEIMGPDSARGIWAMEDLVRFRPDMPIREFRAYGHYHETYRRTDAGWRISSTKLTRIRVDIL